MSEEDAYAKAKNMLLTVKPEGLLKKAEQEETPTDDDLIDLSQKLRIGVINCLTKNGTEMPADPDERIELLEAAKAMGALAVSRKRIKADEKINDDVASARSFFASIFSSQAELLESAKRGTIRAERVEELPNDFTPIEGQDEINPRQETYEEFMSRMEK